MSEETAVQSPIREQNAAFIRKQLAYYEKSPSELGVRAAVLLALWCDGWHHVPNPGAVDWDNEQSITIAIHRSLATVDFFDLTKLVFFAHDEALRVEIKPPNMPDLDEEPGDDEGGGLQLLITARRRGGVFYEDHPTLEAAVLKHRCQFPESEVLQ